MTERERERERETNVTSNRSPSRKNGGRHAWQTETNLTEIDGAQYTRKMKGSALL